MVKQRNVSSAYQPIARRVCGSFSILYSEAMCGIVVIISVDVLPNEAYCLYLRKRANPSI